MRNPAWVTDPWLQRSRETSRFFDTFIGRDLIPRRVIQMLQ